MNRKEGRKEEIDLKISSKTSPRDTACRVRFACPGRSLGFTTAVKPGEPYFCPETTGQGPEKVWNLIGKYLSAMENEPDCCFVPRSVSSEEYKGREGGGGSFMFWLYSKHIVGCINKNWYTEIIKKRRTASRGKWTRVATRTQNARRADSVLFGFCSIFFLRVGPFSSSLNSCES